MTQGSGLTGRKRACLSCQSKFSEDITACPKDGTPLVLVQDDLCGTVLGNKYELLEVIGRGGMGLVYRARHNMMNRIVAIKILNKAHISDSASLKRFQIEAQAASALSTPHILSVFDFGVAVDGQPYMVMDLLNGPSLDKLLDTEGRLPVERTLRICIQVCEALAHAHNKGIVHRDIKPSNIILVQDQEQPDFVKIVDFGIAKLLNPTDPELAGLTRTGEVFGSPLYMSPEQWHAQKLDVRTDIYSLGAVMYRTLCGRFMFDKCDVVQLMYRHVSQMPQPFAKYGVEVPESVEAIVFKALAKQPDGRFQSMSEMSQALQNAYADLYQEPRPGASAETATRLVVPANRPATGQTAAPLVEATSGNSTGSGATTSPLVAPTMTGSNTGSQPTPAPAQMVPTSISFSQSILPGAITSPQSIPTAANRAASSVPPEKKQFFDRKRKIIVSVLSLWIAALAVVVNWPKKPAVQPEIPGTIPAPVSSQTQIPTQAPRLQAPPVQAPPAQTPVDQSVVSPMPPNTVAPSAESEPLKPITPAHPKSISKTQPTAHAVSSAAATPTDEPPAKAEPHAAKQPANKRLSTGLHKAVKHIKHFLNKL